MKNIIKTLAIISFSNIVLADSGLSICNKAKEKSSVVIGYKEDAVWKTKGWFNLNRGQCKSLAKNISGRTYYIYAEGGRNAIWSGKYTLCINPKEAFHISGFENCETRGYKSVSFKKIEIPNNTTSFTQNLTGGQLSKIEGLDIDDGVYVQGFLSDELATIIRIDKSDNTVKVRRAEDGTTKWVSVNKIITREEAQANEIGRAVGGAAIIWCLFSPESCQN